MATSFQCRIELLNTSSVGLGMNWTIVNLIIIFWLTEYTICPELWIDDTFPSYNTCPVEFQPSYTLQNQINKVNRTWKNNIYRNIRTVMTIGISWSASLVDAFSELGILFKTKSLLFCAVSKNQKHSIAPESLGKLSGEETIPSS